MADQTSASSIHSQASISSRRRLEAEMKMFRILSSETPGKSPPAPDRPSPESSTDLKKTDPMTRSHYPPSEINAIASTETCPVQGNTPPTNDHNLSSPGRLDDISTLGNDTLAESYVSFVRTGLLNVVYESMSILRGETPEGDRNNDSIPNVIVNTEFPEGDKNNDSISNVTENTGLPSKKRPSMLAMMSVRDKILNNRSGIGRVCFMDDDLKDMTRGRRIALKLMKKYSFYNPQLKSNPEGNDINGKPAPSLEKAWAFFEHMSLARHVISSDGKDDNKKLERAVPGEADFPTRLYSPWSTPLSQMGDFGLGVGLYFTALVSITVMTFLAGCINIPNIIYFMSEEYSQGQPGVTGIKIGSAICTNQNWYPCPSCDEKDFNRDPERFAMSADKSLIFALKNDCEPRFFMGMVNWATLIFIFLGIFALNRYQKRMQVNFDEDEQTAQDYSILISNPPKDAKDTNEWKEFFESNFPGSHVTCCTINVDNDRLVINLMKRRELLQSLELKLPFGVNIKDENAVARLVAEIDQRRSTCFKILMDLMDVVIPLGIPELFNRITVLNTLIRGLSQIDYPVSNVFLTFETESAQRQVLSALSVGKISVWTNNGSSLKHSSHKFRGEHILNVMEPEEPDALRWQDLNVNFIAWIRPLIFTAFANLCSIGVVTFIIWIVADKNPQYTAIVIALFNVAFPVFGRLLTLTERHPSESGWQTSYYWKIAIFRWVNTAIVTTIVSPFTMTLTKMQVIDTVAVIFIAEIATANVIQLIDFPGNFERHILGPRAPTQELMNLKFRGCYFQLAERYTNMTKIMFLALWYSAIYPATLFLCSFALTVNYFCDRYSLMRSWKPAPKIGTAIAAFNRKYFFSLNIMLMAIMSSFYWAGFPFDNLCLSEDAPPEEYYGSQSITYRNQHDEVFYTQVSVEDNQPSYRFCDQDFLLKKFPAIPSIQPEGDEWMTSEQERLTTIYGWTSVAICCVAFLRLIWNLFIIPSKGLFHGEYKKIGSDMGKNFSDNLNITTFVPQVRSEQFTYPLLVCDTKNISTALLDWSDPDQPYEHYNLILDCEEILDCEVSKDESRTIFDRISHWPPPPSTPS